VVGFVLNWTFRESLVAVSLVFLMYLVACFLHRPPADAGLPPEGTVLQARPDIFANNLYFLGMTGVIVVTGTYFLNQFRYREFVLRYQLDQDRRKLEESNRRLKELDELKSHFFANISHELRTPLTLLLAPLETLLQQPDITTNPQTLAFLRTMQTNGLRLLRLINGLLDLVRLEAGHMEVKPEPLALPEFLQGLTSTLRPAAEGRRIRLSCSVGGDVGTAAIDRDKIEKILLNLLFNALKFTPANGQVEMRATREADQLVLQVQDSGVGISEQQLPHVFGRFWQADSSARRQYPGAGIGLALVKELTEIQQGTVAVESVSGQGTLFTVRLPYVEALSQSVATTVPTELAQSTATALETGFLPGGPGASEEWLTHLYRRADFFGALTVSNPENVETKAAADAEAAGVAGQPPTVLVADDEPDMLLFLETQLGRESRVVKVTDGEQAVRLAGELHPDLVLLDLMMPKKDGLQACREIRESPATRNVPIILLTARADEETKLSSLSAGASDFLSKPFSTSELRARVRNLIQSFRLQQRLVQQNSALAQAIDQLKETEVQLIQAEKLASLGRLSAGIIHEINNPLNYAATGLYSLRSQEKWLPAEKRTEFTEILDDVEEGVRRVKNIVTDLRAFTHSGAGPLEEVAVDEVVEMALRFLSHEWKNHIEIHRELAPRLTVMANHNRLVQVLVNLLQNSFDALQRQSFPNGGPEVWIRAQRDAAGTQISVRDNGVGIEPGILDKVFDPFFTTKDVGKGLGLGLSISYRILQEFGGQILVRSEPGRYTEFTLRFPSEGAAA
jgi:signal transduction histidine kinase